MILLPAIDLMDGQVVQLVGGVPGTERIRLADPLAVAQRWVREGARWLHIVDLDAALGKGENGEVIERILANTDAKVQVGGGVRDDARISELLAAGAKRVVVGTQGLKDPVWFARAAQAHPRKLILAVDARQGKVVAKGWTEGTGREVLDVAKSVDGLPLAGLLYTAVHVEGKLEGVDRTWTPQLVRATKHPVFASGGVTSLDDVRILRDAGCAGAVAGLALYLDRFSFPQAQALAEVPTA